MGRIRYAFVAGVSLAFLSAATLVADVRTEEKSHVKFEGMLGRMMNMFGGKAAKEGVVTQVAVKGDRKLSRTEQGGQLIDLGEEKIYDIDFRRKTYKVTTFEELRQKMREAEERAKKDQERADRSSEKPADGREYEIDVDVKRTGAKKAIHGFDTTQVVTTVTVREKGRKVEQSGGLVLVLDSWLAPTIAAMKEVQDFDIRYAQKLYGPIAAGASAEQMAAVMAMYPMLKQALGRVNAEGAKLDGTPIATTMTVEAVKSPEQMRQEQQQDEESAGAGGIGGMLARKMMKRKGDDEPKPRATIMTTTHEVLSVATSVGADDVAIPAGFKQRS